MGFIQNNLEIGWMDLEICLDSFVIDSFLGFNSDPLRFTMDYFSKPHRDP